jgi:hypothetical protein
MAQLAFLICAHLLYVRVVQRDYRGRFYQLLYIAISGDYDFTPHLLLSALDYLFLTPLLSHFHYYF